MNFNNQEFKKIKEERVSRNQGSAALNYPSYNIDQLKIIQEDYRRLRDLSLISFIGVYVLQIIDANVEAHLFLFDISDHLGFKLKPTFLIENETNYFTTQISFNIKLLKKQLLIINKITFLIKNEIVWKNMIYVLLELDPQVMRQQ